MNTTLTGREGEAKAADYLRRKKYEVIGANYRCRFGELDLIAKKRELVIFVEVKLRKNDRFGAAADAVTFSKQDKLRKTAASWLAAHDCDAPTRFDVIEIYTDTGRINHIENVFE
jgi:putative endonuclease